MPMDTTTLRPGLLVSLKTSTSGNVEYKRTIIQSERVTSQGTEEAIWETKRIVIDPAEYEGAKKVRSQAAGLIRSVCAASAFGLLCPMDDAESLSVAILEARNLIEAYNRASRLTKVSLYVITGRIAESDRDAVAAINSEVRDLLGEMQSGIQNLDVKQIREAAGRAKQLGSMLTPEAQTRLQMAIDSVRSAARKIVKAGETAAGEIDRRTIRTIREARSAFLDIAPEDEPVSDVQAPVQAGRALDLELDGEEAA